MKTLFISLFLLPLCLMAQTDYNYNQVNQISTNNPVTKIMWIKQSQFKQSVTFDHLLFFVKETNSDNPIGDELILKIYHNNELIHTKDIVTVSEAPTAIFLLNPIPLKKYDSLFLELSLKPNPNKSPISYMINIQNRNTYLRNHTQQYREFLKTEASTPNSNTIASNNKPKYATGLFGERLYTNNSKKRKKSNNGSGIVNTLGFLFGM